MEAKAKRLEATNKINLKKPAGSCAQDRGLAQKAVYVCDTRRQPQKSARGSFSWPAPRQLAHASHKPKLSPGSYSAPDQIVVPGQPPPIPRGVAQVTCSSPSGLSLKDPWEAAFGNF